jgi:hypothetical protein
VEDILSKDYGFMIKPWDKPGTFFTGEYILDAIRRQVYLSDFAILIVSPDDDIIKHTKHDTMSIAGSSPRDNVLLELGIFMGMLGRKRSICLSIDDQTKENPGEPFIPVDLGGIIRIILTIEGDEQKDNEEIANACARIKEAIEREMDVASSKVTVNPLPSTSLAVGYFNNFIMEVGKVLESEKLFISKNGGQESYAIDLSEGNYEFIIMLPDNDSTASHAGVKRFMKSYDLVQIRIMGDDKTRQFPFYVNIQQLQDNQYKLYDYPTTLRAAIETVELISNQYNFSSDETNDMEEREIDNFKQILESLLKRNLNTAYFRDKFKVQRFNSVN